MLPLLLGAAFLPVLGAAQEIPGLKATEAIWSASFGGTPGRTGQSQLNGPLINGEDPLPYNHILKVSWRWLFPGFKSWTRSAINSFLYGALDSDGGIYYLGTGNGANPHTVYKLSPSDGSVVWQSVAPPRPYYANFYGNDHLFLDSNKAVYVVTGTTYTLADCAWIQKLDAQTGKQLWWLNGTATIANALLSADATKIYLVFANGTVSAISAADASLLQQWDVTSIFPSGTLPTVYFTVTLAPAAAGKPNDDVLLFSLPPGAPGAQGNVSYAALITSGDPANALLWTFEDPLGGAFTPILSAPTTGSFVGEFFFAEGNNYQQGQGSAAFNTLSGKLLWSKATGGIISASNQLAAEQGWMWTVNYFGSGGYAAVGISSLKDGSQLSYPQYYDTPGFASPLAISGDGQCGYLFGSGMVENQGECNLLQWCYNGTTLNAGWQVPITGVKPPNAHYQLVPGPTNGQLALFHGDGVMVLERYELQDAPAPPVDPTGGKNGLVATLILGKSDADCSNGGGNVTVTPALIIPAPAGSGGSAPQWVLGETLSSDVFPITGTCNAFSAAAPIDTATGRAWFPFSCSNIVTGQYYFYLAQVNIQQEKPVVTNLCYSRSGFNTLFFDASVNTTSPWYLDAWAEFTRYFYTVTAPPLSSWNPANGGQIPPCIYTAIGQLGGTGLIPSNSAFGNDGQGRLFAASSTYYGMRVMTISVPGGSPLGDVTLPCDTAVCVQPNGVEFVGSTRDSSETIVVGGSAPYFQDWPGNAGNLAYALLADTANTTFTGLVSKQYPTFPLTGLSPSPFTAFLADPNTFSNKGEVSWLQSFYTGPTACTTSQQTSSLQTIAFVGAAEAGSKGNITTLVVNATVPACALKAGFKCFSMGVGHVQAFTS